MSDTIVTPEATLSFPSLFVARGMKDTPDQNKKFSAKLIFPEGTDLSTLQAEAQAVAAEKWPNGAPANIRVPINRDDEGNIYMNISSREEYPPQVVGPDRQPIINQSDIYPGCKVVAGVRFYAYDKAGNRGVAAGMVAVMKTADGERLDTTVNADALFSGVQTEAPTNPAPAGAFDLS